MTISKQEIIEEYVKEIRNKVGNFDLKVQTSVLLFNFFKSKEYDFYFTPKIKKQQDNSEVIAKTPDFLIRKEGKADIIGEIKEHLPNPKGENYDKKANNDLEQLKEYTEELVGISTPHDVFFSSPSWCNEAIAYYIQKIDKNPDLKGKIIVLKYHWMKGNSHSKLSVSKVYGDFKDNDINQHFMYGKELQVGEGDLNQIQGYYKILYTEEEYNETPVEYIMLVLWHNVFPELIKTADFNSTIERIKKGENSLEFHFDEIMDIIDKLYTLKKSETEIIPQFTKEMIKDALKSFSKIGKVQELDASGSNPKYRVTHSKIFHQKMDLLDYLIRELHKDDFEKKAEIELNKRLNKNLSSSLNNNLEQNDLSLH